MTNFTQYLTQLESKETVYYSKKTEFLKQNKFVERYFILAQSQISIFDRTDKLKYTAKYENLEKLERAPTGIVIYVSLQKPIVCTSPDADIILDIISQSYRRICNSEIKKEYPEFLLKERVSVSEFTSRKSSVGSNYEDEKWAEFWKIRFSSPGIDSETFQKFRIALELSKFVWANKIIDAGLLTSMIKITTDDLRQQYLWTFRTIINSEYSISTICKDEVLLTFLANQTQVCSLEELIDIIQIFSFICCQSSEHQKIILNVLTETSKEPFLGIGKRLQINAQFLKLNTFILTFINIMLAGIEEKTERILMRSNLENSSFGTLLKELKFWCKPKKTLSKEHNELWYAIHNYTKEAKEEANKKTEILTTRCGELEELVRIYKNEQEELNTKITKQDDKIIELTHKLKTASVPKTKKKIVKKEENTKKEDVNAGGLAALDFSAGPPSFLSDLNKNKNSKNNKEEDINAGGLGALDFSAGPPSFLADLNKNSNSDNNKEDINAGGLAALDFSSGPPSFMSSNKNKEEKQKDPEPVYNLPSLKTYTSSKECKPIFWAPVPLKEIEGSIWYTICGMEEVKVNQEEVETLFAKPKKKKKTSKKTPSQKTTNSNIKPDTELKKVTIFEGMKFQQVSFFYRNCISLITSNNPSLTSLTKQIEFFTKQLSNLHPTYLNFEFAKKCIESFPTESEIKKLLAYKDNQQMLSDTEKFMLNLVEIPNIEVITKQTVFMEEFKDSLDGTIKKVETITEAYRQIQTSSGLKLFLSVLLNIGNICNVNNDKRKNTYGFDITFFERLIAVETNKKGVSLLEYIYENLLEKYPKKRLFVYELESVLEAEKIEMGSLMSGISAFKRALKVLKEDKEKSEGLKKKIGGFLDKYGKSWDKILEQIETFEKVTFPKTTKLFCVKFSVGDSGKFLKIFGNLIRDLKKTVVNYDKKGGEGGGNKVGKLMQELTDKQTGKSQLDKIKLRNK